MGLTVLESLVVVVLNCSVDISARAHKNLAVSIGDEEVQSTSTYQYDTSTSTSTSNRTVRIYGRFKDACIIFCMRNFLPISQNTVTGSRGAPLTGSTVSF